MVLDWKVTESDRPNAWTVQAETDFIGPIVVRYTFERVGDATRYTRHLRNPSRPSAASAEQIQRVDEEAQIGLNNIKRQVEQRGGAARRNRRPGEHGRNDICRCPRFA